MADIRVFNVFLDFVIFCGVAALVIIPFFYEVNFLKVLDRGFSCDDNSITYPLKEETVPTLYMYIGIFALIIIFLFGEILFYCLHTRKQDDDRQRCVPCGCNVNPIIANIYKLVGLYVFGEGVTHLITMLVKRMVGGLRPNFLALCDYNCAGSNSSELIFGACEDADTARESFPSGHASSAFYCLTFIVMYLEARLLWRSARLVKPLLQAACLFGATFIAFSRVYDFYHHLGDVIAGALLGAGIAILVAYYLTGMFRRRSSGGYVNKDGPVEMSNYVVRNSRTQANQNWSEYTM